ncbi:MAG: acyl-[ACP]--phospholipid O-acyltransferase [Candidatus Electrothrix aestuarii]|uniref:Acyl-[ACP]--phospholipid O-acyltransferase n=1 Tax=Candidatus Electrothrix aestuarii TaxID=3062594 RepID=A0AAU8M1W4_9BACT|nr:acyl-[ACP]--phospholipid O-acyltransferase [Candidatus Electrothrix aestuarii]
MKKLISLALLFLLRLRYRIRVDGLKKLKANTKDNRPLLFLPNHQALIDPVVVMSLLFPSFTPRPLVDENQSNHPLAKYLMDMVGAIFIPDLNTSSRDVKEQVFAGIEEIVASLKRGENVLMYPAGRISRGHTEVIGANSGAVSVVHAVPEARIVLLRIRGLWGSRFSRAHGLPSLFGDVGKLLFRVLANAVFFMPRRPVHIEIVEPEDFPRSGDKKAINRYLEEFYNFEPDRKTEIPSYWWQGHNPIYHDEVQAEFASQDTGTIPDSIRSLVLSRLTELSGIENIQEEDKLAADLGMDSLVLAEFGAWMHQEFGVATENLEVLQRVSDCILAAGGIMPALTSVPLKPVSSKWFEPVEEQALSFSEGDTIAELFLRRARQCPGQVVLSDQVSGDKTWRQLIMAVYALLPEVTKLPEKRVGIMMPASVSAAVSWLVVMFSGKEPVMVNWTSGTGNMQYSLQAVGVRQVITAKALTSQLEQRGIALDTVGVTWLYLEDMATRISGLQKVTALVKSWLPWRALQQAKIAENAAILFTSGSEARPKAVPLTHANFLANARDFAQILSLTSNDRLLGILPVFHSFGLAGAVVLPLCTGLRTVYWPNPTEGLQLARIIGAYGATTLLATPTFLNGVLRAGKPDLLHSLRLVFSGAEKCPDHIFAALKEQCPHTVLCEGYGVTECSPVVAVNSPEAPQPGTIGRVLSSMEYVLLDPETNEPVSQGKNGRLLVRGGNVFSGYLGDAPSPFVDFDGKAWYDTGDLMFERDGVLVFAGRLKRFVKIGGEMVSLPAIEQVLEAHYPTGDGPVLAVAATADEQHPELVLLTVFETDRQEANQAIRDAGLSPLHNIRMVRQIDEIPLLGSGKTDYTSINKIVNE